MEEFEEKIESLISQMSSLIHDIQYQLKDAPVSKKLRDGINSFHETLNRYTHSIESAEYEVSIEHIKMLGVYGIVTGQGIAETQGLSDLTKSLGLKAVEAGQELRRIAESAPETYRPLGDAKDPTEAARRILNIKAQKKLEMLIFEQEKQHAHIKSRLSEDESKISSLEKKIQELNGLAASQIESITRAYEAGQKDIQDKRQEIDKILGHAAGRTIAGDYEKSAQSEKDAADWLRYASLAVMVVIAGVLCYSIWESTHTEFQWQNSLFRIALAFLLSAPAAYLARESTKHRIQQYQHLQTSLDLKAINPYIATLPDETQHKIKAEIAAKIFSGRDFAGANTESYPINTQELLMELIKRVEIPNKSNGEK